MIGHNVSTDRDDMTRRHSPELIQLCLKLTDPSYTPRVFTGLIHDATSLRFRNRPLPEFSTTLAT
jgi:hypothetical protein